MRYKEREGLRENGTVRWTFASPLYILIGFAVLNASTFGRASTAV